MYFENIFSNYLSFKYKVGILISNSQIHCPCTIRMNTFGQTYYVIWYQY